MEQLGPDLLSLSEWYCLSAVTLPFGIHDIEAAGADERHEMEDIRCQIDLDVSAVGPSSDGEASLEATAQRVLAEACGIRIAQKVWDEDVQLKPRKALGVDLPIRYWDGPESKGFVIILPTDLMCSVEGGLLTFAEPPRGAAQSSPPSGGVTMKSSETVGGKTVDEWRAMQNTEFSGLPKLPEDWIRVKSRTGTDVYFFNTKT